MAKHSSSRYSRIEIPRKSDVSISDLTDNTKNTGFPGSDYLNQPAKGNSLWSQQGTSDLDWDESTKDLQAPVSLPTRQSLTISLVDSNLVYKFEEYRKDGSIFTAFFWALIGAVISILYDLFKSSSFPLSIPDMAFLILIAIFTMTFGLFSLSFYFRANNKLKEIRASEIKREQ